MPKHLVTAIGLVVTIGVIALGVFLVALPLYFQAVGVDTQTATAENTNAIYQTQVDQLHAAEDDLDQTHANVADLRAQIPATGQLDDVFEVVARAAEASGISLTAVTAGEQVPFVARTGVTEGDAAAAPAVAPEPSATPTAEGASAAADTSEETTEAAPAMGRQQVDFAITASAVDMAQATAFLDALRAGPRLLNSITVTSTQGGEGTVAVQVSALTYIDMEG